MCLPVLKGFEVAENSTACWLLLIHVAKPHNSISHIFPQAVKDGLLFSLTHDATVQGANSACMCCRGASQLSHWHARTKSMEAGLGCPQELELVQR